MYDNIINKLLNKLVTEGMFGDRIPSVFEVNDKLKEIEKEYGHLRDDPDFIDFVSNIVVSNAEDGGDTGMYDEFGELDDGLVNGKIEDLISDPLNLEELADEFYEEHPDKRLKRHMPGEVVDQFKDLYKNL